MARKELKFKVTDEGRDKDKVFLITEMAARPGHQWASRMLFAIMNAGIDIPENVVDAGFAGIAAIGIKAIGNVPYERAEPLLAELFTCVSIIPDPSKPNVMRSLIDDDTEEISTLFRLQKEVLALHVQPFMTGVKSTTGLTPGSKTGS